MRYNVTTKHPNGYNDGSHVFTVHADKQGEGKADRFFASAIKFGCSKSYATPIDAIYQMCHEHACVVMTCQKED